MGQATVKAARRQIRRAVGAQALDLVGDHHKAIVTLSAILEQTRADVATFKHDLDHRIDVTQRIMVPIESSFRRRLRWLFLGR